MRKDRSSYSDGGLLDIKRPQPLFEIVFHSFHQLLHRLLLLLRLTHKISKGSDVAFHSNHLIFLFLKKGFKDGGLFIQDSNSHLSVCFQICCVIQFCISKEVSRTGAPIHGARTERVMPTRVREGVKKNRFFLGLCPKLWVGGGQKS